MRAISVLSSVVVGCCAATTLMVGPAAAAPAPGGFAGYWVATDTDGSSMTLRLLGSGGDRYSVHMVDDEASVCGGVPANVVGSAVADGDALWAQVTLTCKPGGNLFRHRIGLELEYDATNDVLLDGAVVWNRAD